MKEWESVDEVIDFAIRSEVDSIQLYQGLAGRVEKPWMKKIFTDFAKEEEGHRKKLLKVKEGQVLKKSEEKVLDLKIGDYLVDVEPTPDMDYQDALILAMKKEKASFMLYTNLAYSTKDQGLRDTFLALAQEEAKHKLRFEMEYEDKILVWD
jgi:rubrerythrin